MPKLTPVLVGATERRGIIREKALDGVKAFFPLETNKHTLHVEDVSLEPADYSSQEQKHAVLEGRTLSEAIKGTLVLKDKDGKIVDKTRKLTLLQLPWFTERHTFILDGNEYSIANQIRLRPGVYTRRRGNHELESQFNLVKKGGNFSLAMEPETGRLLMRMSGSNIDLYPVLRGIGVSHKDIADHWGHDLAAQNEKTYGKKIEPAITKLYHKILPDFKQTAQSHEERVTAIRNWFSTAGLDKDVTRKTLGVEHEFVKPETLLRASQKLIKVFNNAEDLDDRDSLEFKRLHSVDDFLRERLIISGRDLRRKIVHKLEHAGHEPSLKSVIPASMFTPTIKSFVQNSGVASTPTNYNPMEVIDVSQRITPLGEGGIGDIRAMPYEARQLHHSHLGVIDLSRTSESEAAGADVRATIFSSRDQEGNLYTPVWNPKANKMEHVSVATLAKSTVAFPGQNLKGKKTIDALVDGQVKAVQPHEVHYEIPHPAAMYSPVTNLLPFIESMQGNRTLMGAKMQTQALALKEKEAPLVQVESYRKGRTMEREFGEMTVPVAPVHGTVAKVDKEFIYIKPHGEKHAGHAADRLAERTTLPKGYMDYLEDLAEKATEKGLAGGKFHYPLPFGKGHAIFNTVGNRNKKLVVATILGPDMVPDGRRLPAYVEFKKQAADKDEGLVKVKYDTYSPLGVKSYLHNELNVKEGDSVKKDQPLAESNFTTDGVLSLGKNLKTAYMAYRGLNSNDAIVISESAAKKLTSLHMYAEKMDLDPELILGKERHRTYFGNKYTKEQYGNLDDDGVIKKGSKVNPGDPLFLSLSKTILTPEAAMLGKLHKSLVKPYRDTAHTWEHGFPGVVEDVVKTPKRWAITVRTEEPMVVGDKLSGRHGNKGIVGQIIPDDQMVRDESGEPIDVLLTSAGVVSRINPSQILETAVAKVADKIGKPIAVPQFPDRNNVEWAKKLLKEHGVKDKETVYDPVTGKYIPNILVGKQYMLKLMKSTYTNYSARGIGQYDINEQPLKGGVEGSKGFGRMEWAGLVAHNARNMMKENSLIRSQRNDEFWRRLQLGLPPPAPKTTFAFNKFTHMLAGAGIKFDKTGTNMSIGPLTDDHVKKLSRGEITKPLFVTAKDLRPETDGLFDPAITGGLSGEHWGHVALHEPMVNPIFEDSARRLLGMTGPAFKTAVAEKGGGWVKRELAKIDLAERKKTLKADLKNLRGPNLDNAVKQIKYIEALEAQNLTPQDAYVLSKIPVIPPQYRPITPGRNGTLLTDDANHLYRDLMLANEKLKVAKDDLGTATHIEKARTHLYDATRALFGLDEPVSPQNKSRGVKGFLSVISGVGSPKYGFLQGKLIRRQLDLSGRGTIAPDVTLNMDQIGLPEDMIWTMFEPFIVARLVKKGYDATEAKKLVEKRALPAREEMLKETKERPVVYNRAPSLHRYNIIGAYPVPVAGQTVRIPATWGEPLMGADFDGDTMQIHTPVTHGAIQDAKKMTIPNLLFADKVKGKLHVIPAMEAVIGAYAATSAAPSGKKARKFKNRAEALAAYNRGDISINDPVIVEDEKK